MSDLTTSEKRKLERLFEMGSGHALDLTHRTLGEFVEEHAGRDVYAKDYPERGSGSKAWKIRMFWEVEPNHLCAKLIAALIDYRAELGAKGWGPAPNGDDEDGRRVRSADECDSLCFLRYCKQYGSNVRGWCKGDAPKN